MAKKNLLGNVARALLIVGGITWGTVALFNLNLVSQLLASVPTLLTAVYVLVGVAGVIELINWVK